MQTIWFTLNPYFLSGNMEFWYMAGRGYLHDQSPVKTRHWAFLIDNTSPWCQNPLGGWNPGVSGSYRTPLGEKSWNLVPGSQQTLPHAFSHADLAWYLFTVINHNHVSIITCWVQWGPLANLQTWVWAWEPLTEKTRPKVTDKAYSTWLRGRGMFAMLT